jgi:DNA-binding transcriptional ArsR family regulator
LSRAYKGKAHREILLSLAKEHGLTLSEIARRIGKPSGEVSNYLKALLRTDLIIKEDDKYYFRDPILRFWLAETYLGAGRTKLTNKVIAEQLIHDLQEKYLAASAELGKAKEYEMKVKLEARYEIKLENYPEEGEFDLVGKKNGTAYIFEIKWRNKPVDFNQIHDFFTKVGKSKFAKEEKRLFIVSKEGFTKNAELFGKKHGIEMLRDE